MPFPKLPARAAYLTLNHTPEGNLINVEALKSLIQQLTDYNTPPGETKPLLLPEYGSIYFRRYFKHGERQNTPQRKLYAWMHDADKWQQRRADLPKVLVLRAEGPDFSRGYDLKEHSQKATNETKHTFKQIAEVVRLMRSCPTPIVSVIHGLAAGPGAQLGLTADLPVAAASAQFQLPDMAVGLPSTLFATSLSRRFGNPFTYRMFALGEPVRANQLPPGGVETVADDGLEERVSEIVEKLANSSGMAQALGKWAYWSQAVMSDPNSYYTAANWAAELTVSHSITEDAREGIQAFLEERDPEWKS
ncbi:enoyl-CoA hydratase [Nemania sp. FL0031]|nr:enoyl-CoA hydratase [Nemania sp. FL0031]